VTELNWSNSGKNRLIKQKLKVVVVAAAAAAAWFVFMTVNVIFVNENDDKNDWPLVRENWN